MVYRREYESCEKKAPCLQPEIKEDIKVYPIKKHENKNFLLSLRTDDILIIIILLILLREEKKDMGLILALGFIFISDLKF